MVLLYLECLTFFKLFSKSYMVLSEKTYNVELMSCSFKSNQFGAFLL